MKRWIRRKQIDERGAILVITSLSIVALVGITALVVDIGNANQRGRSAQSVTDASSLAGGWELPTAVDARTVAADYVADNLEVALPVPDTCPVEPHVTVDTVCYTVGETSIQITTPWDSSDYLLRVQLCEDVDTTFAKVIGFSTMTVCREAISEVEPPTPGAPGGPAIQTFGIDDKKSFETTGNGTIWTDGNIYIGSTAGEAFVADGSGGVTALGEVWFDSTGGGCASPPECGTPGFLNPPGTLPMGCDPAVDCGGGLTHFQDVYLNHAIRSIDFAARQTCLESDFPAGCEFYDPGVGYPVHAVRAGTATDGPLRTGDTTTPTCDNGDATMDPGYYSTTGQYSITGCVIMNPGIYVFAGGFDMEAAGFVRGNDVLLINAHDKTVSRITKSAVCLTGILSGSFTNFLYYQNPLNDNTFDVESDSRLFLAGIVYNPDGETRIQGADAGTIGGDGTPGSGCLGQATLLGGSIVAKNVLVKSDGTLSINAFAAGVGTAGGGWVRLYE